MAERDVDRDALTKQDGSTEQGGSTEQDASTGRAGPSEQPGLTQSERVDVLLTHYEQMREETRMISQFQDRRILRGIASIAVVIGSAAVRTEAILLVTVVPFILWIIFTRQVQSTNWILRLESHIVDIQDELDVEGFDWERKYGFQSKPRPWGMSVANVTMGIFLAITYVVSSMVSIAVVRNADSIWLSVIPLSPQLLRWIYVVIGLFGVAAWLSYVRTFEKERRPLRE